MDFLFDPFQEENETGAAQAYANLPPAPGAGLAALIRKEPTQNLLLGAAEEASQDPSAGLFRSYLAGNAAAYGAPLTADDLRAPPTPTISPEETKQYSADGKTALSDKPIPQGLAEVLGREQRERIEADSAIRRFEANTSWLPRTLTGMVADATDPLKLSTLFVPGLGEEAVAARLGLGATFLGRTAARGISGVTFGAAAQAPISAVQLALDPDYHMRDFLYDTAVQAPFNAALAVIGAGALRESYRYLTGLPPLNYASAEARPVLSAGPQAQHDALGGAVSQIVEGKPIDVTGFFYRPPVADTAIGRFMENRNVGALPEHIGGTLDVDRIARQTDPATFRVFDTLTAQKQDLTEVVNKPGAGSSFEYTEGLRDQVARLRQRAENPRLSARERTAIGEQLGQLEESLSAIENKPEALDVGAARQQIQQIEAQMRDLAPKVTAAYDEARGRAAMLGAGLAAQQQIELEAWRAAFNRPILSDDSKRLLGWRPPDVAGVADRARGLATNGWAPGIELGRLEAATKEVFDRPAAAAAAAKPEAVEKPPPGWLKPAEEAKPPAEPGAKPPEAAAPAAPAAPGEAAAPVLPKLSPEVETAVANAEHAFAAIDHTNLLPEELEAIRAAEEDVRWADDEGAKAVMEAASCITEAGG
jgi:hypothetical protein